MDRLGVLIVDDSAVVRQVLREQLAADRGIEVLAAAADPILAMERMKVRWPDVIVLDIEMPRMNGITFLRKIMAERPTPVVICATLTDKAAHTTMEAMSAGAVSIIAKPALGVKQFLVDHCSDLVGAVKAAACSRRHNLASRPAAPPLPARRRLSADAMLAPPGGVPVGRTAERMVAIGTSTGGTQALEQVLTALPRTTPGLVIVQHMPERFTAAFAERLDTLCEISVREARDGDRVLPGVALIAPGGMHTMLKRNGSGYHVEVANGPLVSRHRPSVDVLFRSVARCAGRNALGILMTGMGDDGARGLFEMHEAQARTAAQDEHTCVVFGMPREAIRLGAADEVLALPDIADWIVRHA